MILEPDLSKYRQITESTSQRVPTLKKRSDFLRLRSGKRYPTRTLTLQSAKMSTDEKNSSVRIGYTVTKKVGNAVVRNRIKRRLREAAKQIWPLKSRPDHDYVVIGKHGALTQDFTSILKDLEQALDHVHQNGAKGSKKINYSGDAAQNTSRKTKDT